MFIQKKALYNLLLINLSHCEDKNPVHSDLQKWQVENYREKTTDDLFRHLSHLNISLDSSDFEVFSKSFETPEEMAEALAKGKEPLEQDQLFLLIFELWRRFFPERRSLSIFCDELDHLIMSYDLGKKVDAEALQDALAYLQNILDEHFDKGVDAKQCFNLIQMHSASDIESFLFDYILDEIETENFSYATELLEGFYKYVTDVEWFDYLKARAEILREPEEGYDRLETLVQKIKVSEDRLDLIKEILFFLANSGNHTLFHTLAKKGLSLLKVEEDFRDYLEICHSHYDYLELKSIATEISDIFQKRSTKPLTEPLAQEDPDLAKLAQIIDQKLSFAVES